MQVHDELVVDVAKEELETVTRLVTQSMEDALKLEVPLVVDAQHGATWLEAH